MKQLVQKFEDKKPEIVFEWSDPETEAEGWVVINSLRGGAAGGGTRMRLGLDKREVESLAKTMEIKFTVSGPAIGGAKSGINFDPNDPRKEGVLRRWYAAVKPLLKYYYGTGGDLNVDEIHEVIPITEDVGVWHPQEGVFTGHFQPREPQMINRIGQLRNGVIKVLEDEKYSPSIKRKYTVADMITGYGVSEAVRHYYNLWGGNVNTKRAVIQGWGNVGAAAGFYLTQMGVKVVGIIDREGGLIKEEGFTFEEIKSLYLDRNGNKLSASNMIPFEEVNEKIWDLDFEVFQKTLEIQAVPRLVEDFGTGPQVGRGTEGHAGPYGFRYFLAVYTEVFHADVGPHTEADEHNAAIVLRAQRMADDLADVADFTVVVHAPGPVHLAAARAAVPGQHVPFFS